MKANFPLQPLELNNDEGLPEESSAEEAVKAPTVEKLAELHKAMVRQELEATAEKDTAWNDILAAVQYANVPGLAELLDGYIKAERDLEEAKEAQKGTEKLLREAAVVEIAAMGEIEGLPYPEITWITTTNNKVFTIHDRRQLAEFLLKNNREDLIEIGGKVDDKVSLIKSKLLPRQVLADGSLGPVLMEQSTRPAFTLRDKILREQILAELNSDNDAD